MDRIHRAKEVTGMKFIKTAVAAAIFFAISGCAVRDYAPSGIVAAEVWGKQITYSRDDYKKTSTTKGGDISTSSHNVFLRAVRVDGETDTGKIIAYVMVRTSEWKFLDSAYTIDGKEWPTIVLDRDVNYCSQYGCSLAEHVVVRLPREYLATRITEGVQLKLSGKRGEEIVYIPGNYVRTFLAALPMGKKGAVE